MRPLLLHLCLALGLTTAVHAQNQEPINSGNLIREGNSLHDQGKYKEAITLYRKIPRNDTNYVMAQYELAFSLSVDSSFTDALHVCEKALTLDDGSLEQKLLGLRASIVDDMGDRARAIRLYDSALLRYPRALNLRLNKGLTLVRMERNEEAERIFQEIVLMNPFYGSAHYRLAQMAFRKGQIVPGMMALYVYLLNHPSASNANMAIRTLSSISKGTDDIVQVANERKTEQESNFTMVEQIIFSKIALDKKYKSAAEFDDPVLRQLQVLMEKLEYDPSSEDFFMQFYVPLLKKIHTAKLIEPALMHAFSDLDLEPIQKYVKKNSSETLKAQRLVSDYFTQAASTREPNFARREKAPRLYHFNDGEIYGKGRIENDKASGTWEYFYPNGNLKSKGAFNDKGQRQGKWDFYNENGTYLGFEHWKDGQLDGEDCTYNRNGKVSQRQFYRNGKLHGEKTSYYYIGHKHTVTTYKDGVEDGSYTEYHRNGRLSTQAGTRNNNLHGAYTSFYENGRKHVESNYNEGKLEGSYRSYYDNGQLESEGTYRDGELEGAVTTYHANGKVQRTSSFVRGKQEGEEIQYDEKGTVTSKSLYSKGKIKGESQFYDNDGKLFCILDMDNNKLNSARYFDKSGKEIASSKRKGKSLDLTTYSPEGFKANVSTYDDAGIKIGKDVSYFPSGKVREENTFKDGELEGTTVGYYPNGQKEFEVSYRGGKREGYTRTWFMNGQLKSQSFFRDGKMFGDDLRYNEKGKLTSRETYYGDVIYGVTQSFYANGQPDDEAAYTNTWLNRTLLFDTLGRVYDEIALTEGNMKFSGKHMNGRIFYEGSFADGSLHGAYQVYYFDGARRSVRNYDRGLLNGDYVEYHHNGKVAYEGKYDLGKRVGLWKFYNDAGQLIREEPYINGEEHGVEKRYASNGRLERELEYAHGERNGYNKRFSYDGMLAEIIYYRNDRPYAYTYEGSDGKLVKLIEIPGGTGKVRSFYRNGKKSAEMQFEEGLLQGPYKVYNSDGQVDYEEENIIFGLTTGRTKSYYPGGKLKAEYTVYYDNRDGAYKEYHENGKVKEEGRYYNGVQHGAVQVYENTGKLKETQHYYYGQLITITR